MHGILRFITQRRNLIFVILASIVAVVLAFYVAKFLGSVTSVPTTPAASGDPPSGWRDIPFKDLLQIVIIPIFLAYLSWYLGTKDRDARHGPIPIVPGEKKNTILMLGLGRTGKTTIVNTLAGKKISGTEEQTEKFQIYQYFVRNPKKWILDKGSESDSQNISEKPVSFYIPDYRGQDLSKMIRGFLVEQTKANTPLRYGDINHAHAGGRYSFREVI